MIRNLPYLWKSYLTRLKLSGLPAKYDLDLYDYDRAEGMDNRRLLSLIHILSSKAAVTASSSNVSSQRVSALFAVMMSDVDVYKRQVVHTVNDEYSLFAIYSKRPSESIKYSTWGVRRQR